MRSSCTIHRRYNSKYACMAKHMHTCNARKRNHIQTCKRTCIHGQHTYTSINTCKAYIYTLVCIYIYTMPQTDTQKQVHHSSSVTHRHIHIHADRLTHYILQTHPYMTFRHIHEGTYAHKSTHSTRRTHAHMHIHIYAYIHAHT